MALAYHQDVHPLELKEVRYIWGDYHTANISDAFPKRGSDAFAGVPRSLAFSFEANVLRPIHILEKMDVNIFEESHRFDTWVFNTLYAKFRGQSVLGTVTHIPHFAVPDVPFPILSSIPPPSCPTETTPTNPPKNRHSISPSIPRHAPRTRRRPPNVVPSQPQLRAERELGVGRQHALLDALDARRMGSPIHHQQ